MQETTFRFVGHVAFISLVVYFFFVWKKSIALNYEASALARLFVIRYIFRRGIIQKLFLGKNNWDLFTISDQC